MPLAPRSPALRRLPALLLLAGFGTGAFAADTADAPPTTADILAAAAPEDWRRPDPGHTLYLDLPGGRVVIELAPTFAPEHVDNIRRLARAGYWDGLSVNRVQDNYVAQWGDPAPDTGEARGTGTARAALPAEFDRSVDGLEFVPLADGDVYAPEAGWADGFPVGRDPRSGRAWLAHCYGMVGAGRGMAADSSTGADLYAVIGHAPRHLDRNITTVGRVVSGIEHLSTLPRGTGPMGTYTDASQRVPVLAARLAADLPEAERTPLEILRTDTAPFRRLLEIRRHRRDEWFIDPVGRVELCNVSIPVRTPPEAD